MTDIDKVLTGLECLITNEPPCDEGCPYYGSWHCLKNIAKDARELLKEQEPKPVKVTKNAYNYEFYYCPNCGREFELTYYKRPAYCDKCGQAVKWND